MRALFGGILDRAGTPPGDPRVASTDVGRRGRFDGGQVLVHPLEQAEQRLPMREAPLDSLLAIQTR
jgi:hypothetical protein